MKLSDRADRPRRSGAVPRHVPRSLQLNAGWPCAVRTAPRSDAARLCRRKTSPAARTGAAYLLLMLCAGLRPLTYTDYVLS